jgi:hypothetical protein
VGDIITVLNDTEEGWWEGEIVDARGRRAGLFPANYTQPYEESLSQTPPPVAHKPFSRSQSFHHSNTPPPAQAAPTPPPEYNPFEEIHETEPHPQVPIATKPTSLGDRSMTFTATPNQMVTAYNVANTLTGQPNRRISEASNVPAGNKPITITATPNQINSAYKMANSAVGSFQGSSGSGPAVSKFPKSTSYGGATTLSSLANSTPSNTAKPPCGSCGCNDWAQNVFKPQQCNNCFHPH